MNATVCSIQVNLTRLKLYNEVEMVSCMMSCQNSIFTKPLNRDMLFLLEDPKSATQVRVNGYILSGNIFHRLVC